MGRARSKIVQACGALGVFGALFYFGLGPVNQRHSWAAQRVGQAHAVGYLMICYAANHGGKYPDGDSSTEVFQKLLDTGSSYGYPAIDPAVFYIPMPGKIAPVAGKKLKPENVCWDVTSDLDSKSPDNLPIVFMTGYRVDYSPGGAAVPLFKPWPPFERTWLEWWDNSNGPTPGIAVCYKGNRSTYLFFGPPDHPSDAIPDVVPDDFDAAGQHYRQLTPEGVVP